jgi:exonuclease V gamma subunit
MDAIQACLQQASLALNTPGKKIYFSHSIDDLVDRFIENLNSLNPFVEHTVLVPNQQMGQWLLLEIAKKKGVAMGLKLLGVEQLFPSQSPMESFCSIYSALSNTKEPEVIAYLGGKKKRQFSLSHELCSLFFKYDKYPDLELENGWQKELFKKTFPPRALELKEQLFCFGIDFLPPVYWQALWKAPSLSIYLFSPCSEFWADITSSREQTSLHRFLKKRGAKEAQIDLLDTYLKEPPLGLANWGKIGRETLKNLDAYEFETEEIYPEIKPDTLLRKIKKNILHFEEIQESKVDDSIRVAQTGSSKLREIQFVRDEILKLGIPYHEISVIAPDIEPYVPLVEYVFGTEIPFRIASVDISKQSHLKQGLLRLLKLGTGRWDVEEVLTLFETPSFYRKMGWDREVLEQFREWFERASLKWGKDSSHQKAILSQTLSLSEFSDAGSWEKGFETLLETIVFLKPFQINMDLFEELLTVFSKLKELDLKGEKPLSEWAKILKMCLSSFLIADEEDEAEGLAKDSIETSLLEMQKFPSDALYPIEVVEHFLSLPTSSQISASKLHAVRFSSFEEGAKLPAKALFMIGMDEMSFPQSEMTSSLDLLKGKVPKKGDFDRYLFLRSIFSTQEFLRISYSHRSADEGKPVSPSIIVSELMKMTGSSVLKTLEEEEEIAPSKNFPFPLFSFAPRPKGAWVLNIKDLRKLAKHPWRFFLQKAHQIQLDEEWEETFALQRSKLLRMQDDLPSNFLPKPLQRAMELEVEEKRRERALQIKEWQLEPFSLHLKESCEKAGWEGEDYVAPSLEFLWDDLSVKVIGEIPLASKKGIISPHEDTIAGMMKIWPDALAVSMIFKEPQIWMLKNGKKKSFENPEESFKIFIEYFFHCERAPSPLIPDWIDPILRKSALELSKKMQKDPLFKDSVYEWVLARAKIPTAEEIMGHWSPLLKTTFKSLIGLYEKV